MDQCTICTYTTYLYTLDCCNNKICLSCIKSNTDSLCPFCRQVISNKLLDKPENTKQFGSVLFKDLPQIIWLYEARNVGWWAFNYEHQTEIETSYQLNNKGTCSIMVCGSIVDIDFNRMMQTNNNNDAVRAVKRINKSALKTLLVKGVAGMK